MTPKPIARWGVPDLTLERYLCSDLNESETTQVEQIIAASPELQAHLEKRKTQRVAFMVTHPFERIRPRLLDLNRAEVALTPAALARRRGFRPGLLLVLATAAVIGVVTFVALRSGEASELLMRGGVGSRIVVDRGGTTFEYGLHRHLRSGDRLQLIIEETRGEQLWVLGMTDGGVVRRYHGFEHEVNPRLPHGPFSLPQSLTYESSGEREALYLILSSSMLTRDAIERWADVARRTAWPSRPRPPAGARLSVIVLDEEAP